MGRGLRTTKAAVFAVGAWTACASMAGPVRVGGSRVSLTSFPPFRRSGGAASPRDPLSCSSSSALLAQSQLGASPRATPALSRQASSLLRSAPRTEPKPAPLALWGRKIGDLWQKTVGSIKVLDKGKAPASGATTSGAASPARPTLMPQSSTLSLASVQTEATDTSLTGVNLRRSRPASLNSFTYRRSTDTPPSSPVVGRRRTPYVAVPGVGSLVNKGPFAQEIVQNSRTILAHLPPKVNAFLINPSPEIREEFRQDIERGRFRVIEAPENLNPWLQDHLPEQGRGHVTEFRHWEKRMRERIGKQIAAQLGADLRRSRTKLEGGSVILDGDRVAYVSTQVARANSQEPTELLEKKILRAVNGKRGMWVSGLGEGTNHADLSLRSAGKIKGRETIVVADSAIPARKAKLDRLAARLERRKDAPRVVRIKNADAASDAANSPARSYASATLTEGVAFVPTYGDPVHDQAAIKAYRDLGFEVFTIDSREASRNGGGPGCLNKRYCVDNNPFRL
jgi:hypothetical protein